MREIPREAVVEAVKALCIEANRMLPADLKERLCGACRAEESPLGREVLSDIVRNYETAEALSIPVCQDTGMAVVFAELGEDAHVPGLEEAVNEGVRRGYTEGLLRCSVVGDPLRRQNTGDNTPAALHLRLVPGDKLRLTVAPKGFGSENMSRLAMLRPADGVEGVERFVLETVRLAGPNPCPPMVLGVGIGGSFDGVALLAKQALLRPLDRPNPDGYYAALEKKLLAEVNELGIGPQGFGGKTTALGLAIEAAPTHVAGLPVAVNVSCHATRRASAEL